MTPSRRQLAARLDRERTAVERLGIRESARLGRRMRLDVLAAYRDGHNPTLVIRRWTEPLAVVLADAMALAHLAGHHRSWLNAGPALARHRKALSVYDEALEAASARAKMTPADLAAMRAAYSTPATQAAFDTGLYVDRAVQQSIATSIAEGEHVRLGMKRLRETFDTLGMDLPGDIAQGRITAMQPYRLEALYRTNIQLAYSVGRQEANADPAIDEILWGYEYTAVGDARTRYHHLALDGTRLPKDHPEWGRIMPPNGWNCRCSVIEIFKDDVELATEEPPPATKVVEGVTVVPGADEGWAFNPADTMGAAMLV